MDIVKDQVDELVSKLTITIKEEDYNKDVENQLKDIRKKANIKGFRPGKVPMGMIKKMYGKQVMADEVNKALSKSISDYITENKLNLLGEPLPNETDQKPLDFDNDKDFEFVFDIAETPVFELEINNQTKLPFYNIQVDDKLLDEQVNNIKKQFASQQPTDTADEDSHLRGNVVEVTDKAEPFTLEEVTMSLVAFTDEEKAKFVGLKVGEKAIFNPRKAIENDQELANIFVHDKEKLDELDIEVAYTISEILETKDAEINEELLAKIYPNGDVKTEEDLRATTTEEYKKVFVTESDFKLLDDARQTVIDKLKNVQFPEEFLKRFIKLSNKEGNLTDEVLEKEFPIYLDDMRWEMGKSEIFKKNELKIEQHDIENAAKELVKSQLRQYGLPESYLTDENLTQYAAQQLQNEQEAQKAQNLAINKKLITFFKENTLLEEKQVSLDEFKELVNKN